MVLSDLAHNSEHLLRYGLNEIRPLTLLLVFVGGLLSSLGPCSISLLPVTIAYLAGFNDQQPPIKRSLAFCFGILISLVLLGSLSGYLGRIYGQVPEIVPQLVSMPPNHL